MPTVRQYGQVFSLDATDALLLDRFGVGTVFIEAEDAFPGTAVSLPASETITAPALVNVWNNAGVASLRNANGALGFEAHGFVSQSIVSTALGQIFFSGLIEGLSGLTGGAAYLAATAGGVTSTPLSNPGDTSQVVGIAVSSTAINFSPQTPVGL